MSICKDEENEKKKRAAFKFQATAEAKQRNKQKIKKQNGIAFEFFLAVFSFSPHEFIR